MATASILNHAHLSAQNSNQTSTTSPAQLKAMAATNASASTTTTSSDTISANDFLTLLVSELKNQDPTNATDPNAYVNQLVQINSLEQLVSINSTVSGALKTTGATGKTVAGPSLAGVSDSTGNSSGANAAQSATNSQNGLVGSISKFVSSQGAANGLTPQTITNGNISVPKVSNAANRVSHALDGSLKH